MWLLVGGDVATFSSPKSWASETLVAGVDGHRCEALVGEPPENAELGAHFGRPRPRFPETWDY